MRQPHESGIGLRRWWVGVGLENQVDLAGFSWSTAGGGSFDCETELAAWQTGRFCVGSEPA